MNEKQIYIPGVKDEDGWMSERMCQWLFEQATKMNSICEVGSWQGRSTHALCSGCRGKVTAVDHWMGSPGDGLVVTKTQIEGDLVFSRFVENMRGFNNLVIHRAESVAASSFYDDKTFDMVFIDAQHTYESVKRDLDAWLPKAKRLICGHDYFDRFPGVMKAVDERFGKVEVNDVIWSKWLQP